MISDLFKKLNNKDKKSDDNKKETFINVYDNWSSSGSDKKEQDFEGATGKWYPLSSSNVNKVMWDKGKLYVTFHSNEGGNDFVYWYQDPKQKHYTNIMSSASPGRYVWNMRVNAVPYGKR